MPAATVTVNVAHTWTDSKMYHVYGTMTFSAAADTYTSGGIPVSLALPRVKASRPPVKIEVNSRTGSGYNYVFVPGTTIANGLLKIQVGGAAVSSPAADIAAAAIGAPVFNDVVEFEALFLALL